MAIILLANSYHKDSPTSAPEEQALIFEAVKRKITPYPLSSATADSIAEYFDSNTAWAKDIQIFHFAGHAVKDYLVVNSEASEEEKNHLDIEVFAELISKYGTGLKLIFLNACDTAEVAGYLKVPTVIGTTIPVKNRYALRFATAFYDRFMNKGMTVQEALDEAHTDMNKTAENQLVDTKTFQLNEAWLDDPRGNIKQKDARFDPKKIYQAFGDATLRFADWQEQTPAQKPAMVVNMDTQASQDKGLQQDSYLCCNRKTESKTFEERVQRKLSGQNPEPEFLFINSHSEHGPFDLVQRFEKYILQKKWQKNFRSVEYLDFPEADFFDLADAQKPMECLRGIYSAQIAQKMEPRFDSDLLLVLCHKIPNHFWKKGIPAFLEYYVKTFSQILRSEVSERLIVVGLLQHLGKPNQLSVAKKYDATFKYLQENNPQVKYYHGLPLIKDQDVMDWYEEEFKEGFDLKYTPDEEAMSYATARDLIKKIINERHA
ncbi:MAG: CHAT domain-containing protein [Saprospiraceae bacterium]